MALQLKNLECKTKDPWDCPNCFSNSPKLLHCTFFYSIWQPKTCWINRRNSLCGLYIYGARPYQQHYRKWAEDRPDLFLSGKGNSLDLIVSFSLPLELGTTHQNREARQIWSPSWEDDRCSCTSLRKGKEAVSVSLGKSVAGGCC